MDRTLQDLGWHQLGAIAGKAPGVASSLEQAPLSGPRDGAMLEELGRYRYVIAEPYLLVIELDSLTAAGDSIRLRPHLNVTPGHVQLLLDKLDRVLFRPD